jgi:XTP/dITP diphosphohydrolase
MPESNEGVFFATSNQGKFAEVSHVLKRFGIKLHRLESKGLEVQSDEVDAVAVWTGERTASLNRKPVLVEDTGLFIDALGGFPGAYAAHAFRTIGLAGVLKLMKGERARSARFQSAMAYAAPGKQTVLFLGTLNGSIASSSRGAGGFGFDPLFVPSGSRLTLAEMPLAEKCLVSHRGIAARAFGEWYVRHS